MAKSLCFVPGCRAESSQGGPSFARLLCETHRAAIPPAIYFALAMQQAQIDALAERADVLREVVWEIEPERLLEHRSRAADRRLFYDVNFANDLLLCAVAAELPEE